MNHVPQVDLTAPGSSAPVVDLTASDNEPDEERRPDTTEYGDDDGQMSQYDNVTDTTWSVRFTTLISSYVLAHWAKSQNTASQNYSEAGYLLQQFSTANL